jgi:CheY-like chemotaxis protein
MDVQPSPGQAARVPRVLLVDDHPPMRRVPRGMLEDAGMQVVGEAADGLEGVAQPRRSVPMWC